MARHPLLLAARTPDMYSAQFKNGMDALPWMEAQETSMLKAFDANDWIYQTWAYERHDVGTTPGFNGDTAKALASIKAKTLILTGTKDLLNPEFEPREMGKNIPNVKMLTISPGTVTGHASAGGADPVRRRLPQQRSRGVSRRGDGRWEEAELMLVLPATAIMPRASARCRATRRRLRRAALLIRGRAVSSDHEIAGAPIRGAA